MSSLHSSELARYSSGVKPRILSTCGLTYNRVLDSSTAAVYIMAGIRSTSVRYFASLSRRASSLARTMLADWRALFNADFKSRLNSANIIPTRTNNIEWVVHPAIVERSGVDRKSTRLNSSHGYISYAVFCLKKKKKEKKCMER